MLPFFGKKKTGPQTDEEMLAEAFEQVGQAQKKRSGRKRRATLWKKYADPRLLIVLGVIAVLIIADGVRHENREFYARVTEITGSGTVSVKRGAPQQPLQVGIALEDGGEVRTGPNCWASLSFPDGSAITLAPDTHFGVALLEYNRGGMWRGRSFTLLSGHMWARVSPKFGEQSRCKVHTPSSVAAVRGTRFYIGYDPNRRATRLSCNDGAVRVDGFSGRPTMIGGGAATDVSYGTAPDRQTSIDAQTRAAFAQPALNQPIEPDSWLKSTSMKVTSVLDLPLSVLGIGKSSWALLAADAARRTAAMKAMQTIHTGIEGYPTYPDFVNPFTLEELDFRPDDALQILKNFDGHAIEKYQRSGQGFVIYARGRDRARTPFRVTAYGVEQVSEDDIAGF